MRQEYVNQPVVLSGLGSPAALIASGGLQVPGAAVRTKRLVAPRTYRLEVASAIVGPSPVTVRLNGRDLAATMGRTVMITTDPASSDRVQLSVRSAGSDPWPEEQFPDVVEVQWAQVSGAVNYEIRNSADTLLATLPETGDGYYTWTSPPMADEDTETFKVTAVDAAHGVSSSAAEVSVTLVTLPAESSEAEFTYNDDLTVTIT